MTTHVRNAFVAVFLALVAAMLTLSLAGFPGDDPAFEDAPPLAVEGFRAALNGAPLAALPKRVLTHPGDVLTLEAALPGPEIPGATLFFPSEDAFVSASLDGQRLYSLGEVERPFGKAPGNVWNFVALPAGYVGKHLEISLRYPLSNAQVGSALSPVAIATKWSIVRHTLGGSNLLVLFFGALLALLGLSGIISGALLNRHLPHVKRVCWLGVILLSVALWGLCHCPATWLFVRRNTFFYALSFIIQCSFCVAILRYYAACFEPRYKRLLGALSLVNLVAGSLFVLSELLMRRSFVENILFIDVLLALNLSICVWISVRELIGLRKDNALTILGTLIMCASGAVCVAWFMSEHSTPLPLLYGAMVVYIVLISADALLAVRRELEAQAQLRARQNEIVQVLETQHTHYERMMRQIEQTRRLAHDFSQFRTLIYGALEGGSLDKARALIEQTSAIYSQMHLQMFSDNPEVNAIVSYAQANCVKHGVRFIADIRVPVQIPGMALLDLCVLMGNLLDNAVEAASKCEHGEVSIFSGMRGDEFMIRVKNSYAEPILMDRGRLISGKPGDHGIGLSIVSAIVQANGGDLCLTNTDGHFAATVVCPLLREECADAHH